MINDLTPLRDRLYESYVSQHAGRSTGEATRLAYQRSIRPLLPPRTAGPVVDIGCGAGQLVRCLLDDGYEASGGDISPEQVAEAHQDGLDVVSHGDYLKILQDRPGQFAAVTATDLLEHLTKPEVLTTFDAVATALRPGGRFIARVPNAVSPFGGFYRYGDFTHENWFTAASVRQLAAAAGLSADQRPVQAGPGGRDRRRARPHRHPEPDVRGGQAGRGRRVRLVFGRRRASAPERMIHGRLRGLRAKAEVPIINGPKARIKVSPDAVLGNVLISTECGNVEIGDYAFFGHDAMVLTGGPDCTLTGRDRLCTWPKS